MSRNEDLTTAVIKAVFADSDGTNTTYERVLAVLNQSTPTTWPEALRNAYDGALSESTKAFFDCPVLNPKPEELKVAADKIRENLAKLQGAWEANAQAQRHLLTAVQQRCKHPAAQRGSNERDGSWMNPCPACGASY